MAAPAKNDSSDTADAAAKENFFWRVAEFAMPKISVIRQNGTANVKNSPATAVSFKLRVLAFMMRANISGI